MTSSIVATSALDAFEDVRILANTFTGRIFNPLRPDPKVVCIADIAHSSSGMARYFRHTDRPYYTAQHAVILSFLAPPGDELKYLLHDSDETYIGDPIAPLKRQSFMAPFRALSDLWIATVFQAFGLSVEYPAELRTLDERIRINEVRDLYRHVPQWALDAEPLPLNGRPIVAWSADEAEARFLQRFHKLTEGKFLGGSHGVA